MIKAAKKLCTDCAQLRTFIRFYYEKCIGEKMFGWDALCSRILSKISLRVVRILRMHTAHPGSKTFTFSLLKTVELSRLLMLRL